MNKYLLHMFVVVGFMASCAYSNPIDSSSWSRYDEFIYYSTDYPKLLLKEKIVNSFFDHFERINTWFEKAKNHMSDYCKKNPDDLEKAHQRLQKMYDAHMIVKGACEVAEEAKKSWWHIFTFKDMTPDGRNFLMAPSVKDVEFKDKKVLALVHDLESKQLLNAIHGKFNETSRSFFSSNVVKVGVAVGCCYLGMRLWRLYKNYKQAQQHKIDSEKNAY